MASVRVSGKWWWVVPSDRRRHVEMREKGGREG